MAEMQSGKKITARVTQPRAPSVAPTMKGTYCNVFAVHANPEEVVLNFGFDERGGAGARISAQMQVLHKVILSRAMAHRLKDSLAGLVGKPAAPQVRVRAQVAPSKKAT